MKSVHYERWDGMSDQQDPRRRRLPLWAKPQMSRRHAQESRSLGHQASSFASSWITTGFRRTMSSLLTRCCAELLTALLRRRAQSYAADREYITTSNPEECEQLSHLGIRLQNHCLADLELRSSEWGQPKEVHIWLTWTLSPRSILLPVFDKLINSPTWSKI